MVLNGSVYGTNFHRSEKVSGRRASSIITLEVNCYERWQKVAESFQSFLFPFLSCSRPLFFLSLSSRKALTIGCDSCIISLVGREREESRMALQERNRGNKKEEVENFLLPEGGDPTNGAF